MERKPTLCLVRYSAAFAVALVLAFGLSWAGFWQSDPSLAWASAPGVSSANQSAGPSVAATSEALFLNRSLLTVASDVYTTLDGRLLLALWNAIAEPPVPMVTNLEADPVTWQQRTEDVDSQNKQGRLVQSAPDTKRLLYILFVWEESRRLGLFIPSDKALADAAVALQFSDFYTSAPVDVREYWADLGPAGQKFYLNMVSRSKSYIRVRGDLDSNPRLMDVFWFWHGITVQ